MTLSKSKSTYYMAASTLGSLLQLYTLYFAYTAWSSIWSSPLEFSFNLKAYMFFSFVLPAISAVYVFPYTRRFLENKFGVRSRISIVVLIWIIGLAGVIFTFLGVSEAAQLYTETVNS